MSQESVDGVEIVAHDSVLHIALDRPARKNALDAAAIARIVRALEAAAVDESLRAVVVRSAGDDFCAGADWVATNNAKDARPRTVTPGRLLRTLRSCATPASWAAKPSE